MWYSFLKIVLFKNYTLIVYLLVKYGLIDNFTLEMKKMNNTKIIKRTKNNKFFSQQNICGDQKRILSLILQNFHHNSLLLVNLKSYSQETKIPNKRYVLTINNTFSLFLVFKIPQIQWYSFLL